MQSPQIPDRTTSRPRREIEWRERDLALKSSRNDLKRKISTISLQESPIEFRKMRIQDLENEQAIARHDVAWWEIEEEKKHLEPRELKKRRQEAYGRVVSLGQKAWNETTLLHEAEGLGTAVDKDGVDYEGAFASTLLALYKDPGQSKKRSTTMQSELRKAAIQVYQPQKGSPDPTAFWDPIVGEYLSKTDMVAAHVVPHALGSGIADYLFGSGSGSRINSADNCLLIWRPIERAFNNHQFVVIPVDRAESPLRRWKVFVTMDDARNTILAPGLKLGDLDGRGLRFQNEARPAARFLYYHFVITILLNRERRSPGWERSMSLLSGRPFASWGRWMRGSVLLGLARRAEDLSPEFEAALMDPEASFPDDKKLSEAEEKEVGRRCIAEAVEQEKEKGDDEIVEEEEDDDDDE